MGFVRFKLEDQITTAELVDQKSSISRNTGKELVHIEVNFRPHANMRDFYVRALSNGTGTLLSPDGDASKDIVVRLSETHYSYTEGQPVQSCTWELSQVEDLALESLQIGDISVTPYKYKDEFSRDALVCNCCFDVDAETYKYIRNLPDYFPVVRKGVSDEPRAMRFGLVVWASSDEETFRIRATLVEECYDKDGRDHGFLDPMFHNMKKRLAETSLRFSRLLDLMESKGILSADEMKSLFEISDSELTNAINLFNRVQDFDKWVENDQ